MRKTSQDGGDNSSITSGFENEYKKINTGILKSTRNSLKKRVQSLSYEADDAVIEPLLQKDEEKDKVDIASQSAKYLLSKTKTEQRDKEKEKIELNIKVSQTLINTGSADRPGATVANGVKDNLPKCTLSTVGPSYSSSFANCSNGSISSSIAPPVSLTSTEVKGGKPIGTSTGPLIFTTAKIHADGKMKQLEPVHVTFAPISSTIETNKTLSSANNETVQDTPVTHTESQVSRLKAVTNDQATQISTPDIKGMYARQYMSTTVNDGFSTREKLVKLEEYLATVQGMPGELIEVDRTVTPVEMKNVGIENEIVKNKVQPINDSSYKTKDTKDMTIKIEPFVIGNKFDDFKSIGRRNEKLAGKAVSHDAPTNGSFDEKPITKVDGQITNANKNITKTTDTPGATDDNKTAKDTSTSSSSNTGTNKVESTKELQRQNKSTIDKASAPDSKVKPKPTSALPTPTAAAPNKALPKVEPVSKKEVNPSKVNKTGNVTTKDIKDHTKTLKASETSLIPTKTTKVMNVAGTTKPTTTAVTPSASTIKQSSSIAASASMAPSQPTLTKAKPTAKAASSPIASVTTSIAASTAKTAVKITEQKSKDLSKDGKPSKA